MAKTIAKTKKPALKKKAKAKISVKVKLGRKSQTQPFLKKGEPKPFRLENVKGKGPGIIVCDHAASLLPKILEKKFGVSQQDMLKHIAWDIGTEDAALYISKKLDMPAFIAAYSRLVVDLNRDPAHAESIPSVSDHIAVPGNAGISNAARQERLEALFWPYHNAITDEIDDWLARGKRPFILSIHSFTPEMDGIKRPWDIGILWNKEEKLARTFIDALHKKHPEYLIGENEPYSLKDRRLKGSTIQRHAEKRGLPYVFVEFRQDLINTKAKAVKWANIFIAAMEPVLQSVATTPYKKVRR
jgi:predicted N-formylglutamate amidohydrolase